MKFNNKENDFKKQSINIGIIYISMMAIFLLIMVCSYTIPNKRINWHVSESMQQLKTEGTYPRPFFNTPSAQLDNFTDAWMLNLSISADNKHPLRSSLENPHRVAPQYDKGEIDKIQNLELSLENKNVKTESYSRYWHGYLGILRPLLIFFSYTEIRFINMCALFMLFIVVNSLIKKKLGTKVMISFFLPMMMVMFPIVPMSLQFSSMFYVTFISMIVVLLYHEKIEKNKMSVYIFFIIGSITSFLDLLTVPLISLGIPLVTYILLIQNVKIGTNIVNTKYAINNIIEIIKNSILWGLGYGITWASKWVIASIILRQNVITDALNQILSRTSDPNGDTVFTVKSVIQSNTSIIFTDFTIKIIVAILIIGIVSMILYRKNTTEIIQVTPILLIAIMPFVWYIILKNHSQVHCWFTYRNLSITIYAVFAFISYSIDNKKIASALHLK